MLLSVCIGVGSQIGFMISITLGMKFHKLWLSSYLYDVKCNLVCFLATFITARNSLSSICKLYIIHSIDVPSLFHFCSVCMSWFSLACKQRCFDDVRSGKSPEIT